MKKFIVTMLSLVLLATSTGVYADTVDKEYNKNYIELQESKYICSAEASPSIDLTEQVNGQITPFMTNQIGHGYAEWSTWWYDWARATTEVYEWSTASYLYVEATVVADGEADQTETKESTTEKSVTTDKIYQSVEKGRKLITSHIVKGANYLIAPNDEKTEEYSGEYEW